MSKLGRWREPNWYWDEAFQSPQCGGPWDKRKVMALLRRNWKHCRRVKTERHVKAQRARREELRVGGYLGGGVAGS